MDKTHSLLIIITVALVTAALRFLPFIVFSGEKKTPKFIAYLGKVLPYSIMAMLVVYCMKGVSLFNFPFGLPEFIAAAAVAVLHWYKKNTLLSILVGTVMYMLLIQFVFV